MKIKYCPLLSATAEDSLVECQGELCAWYVPPAYHSGMDSRCAVYGLGALENLAIAAMLYEMKSSIKEEQTTWKKI